ncbi:MAG: YqhA family protein [Lewinella sp.]|nr:YqhA family protein [Lewinella sp.]
MKTIAVVAVLGLFALAIGVEYYAIKETWAVLSKIFTTYTEEDKIVEKALHCLDLMLLGTVFFLIGASLYELFVHAIADLPEWLVVEDLDDLKSLVVKMLIVVMAVSFTGQVVTWDGEKQLLSVGLGLAAVVLALNFFLYVKAQEK